jgi:hypothetical protein
MRPVTALLLAGMVALARPALAGSDNPQGFSALQDVRAERLSEREMASITGQGFSAISNALSNAMKSIGEGLATMARKG